MTILSSKTRLALATVTATFAVSSVLLIVAPASAQAPGGGQGGPGGFQMTPAMQKTMQKWRTWRDNHKNVAALQQTLGGINDMEKDNKTRITGAQAKKLLPILTAWRTKPVMTDAQARTVNKQITDIMTLPQIKKIATARGGGGMGGGRRGGGQGGPGGGGGRPGGGGGGGMMGGGGRPGGGGQGGAGGARPAFTMPQPRDYNPLNPASLPFERSRGRAAERMNTLVKALKARAATA